MKDIYRKKEGREALADFMDSILGRLPYPYNEEMVDTRFGATHVVTSGEKGKPVLVLLHGAASNMLGFCADIPKYRDLFYVVAPDIPGEAGKSAPCRPSWKNEDYIVWLDGLLDSMQIEKAYLLGISFGGWIAAKYAASRTERVEKLVLLTPGGLRPARPFALCRSVIYSMQGQKGADKMKHMVFGTDDIAPDIGMFFDLIEEYYVPRFGSPPLLSDSELKSIKAPVLMMAGGEDAFYNTRAAAERLKRVLPDARVYIISRGKHGITETDEKIERFLKQDVNQSKCHTRIMQAEIK